MKYTLYLLIFILSLTSCKKAHHYEVRKIVFQYEYINYAWGYQHQSWFIDTNGLVHLYRSDGQQENWKFPDDKGYITETDLQSDYALADTLIYQLDPTEVKQRTKLIPGISENDLTDISPVMADAGESVLYAYVWDADLQQYKRIFLAESGDLSRVNNHPNAKALTEWLIDKGKNQVKFFIWFN